MVILNIFLALVFLYLGGLVVTWAVADFVLSKSEAEVINKIREIKRMAEEEY